MKLTKFFMWLGFSMFIGGILLYLVSQSLLSSGKVAYTTDIPFGEKDNQISLNLKKGTYKFFLRMKIRCPEYSSGKHGDGGHYHYSLGYELKDRYQEIILEDSRILSSDPDDTIRTLPDNRVSSDNFHSYGTVTFWTLIVSLRTYKNDLYYFNFWIDPDKVHYSEPIYTQIQVKENRFDISSRSYNYIIIIILGGMFLISFGLFSPNPDKTTPNP